MKVFTELGRQQNMITEEKDIVHATDYKMREEHNKQYHVVSFTTGGLEPLHTLGMTAGDPTGQTGSPYLLPSGDETASGSRKREIRLLKNREAARECRRKKKEYIKCLENRVAVLENQNKALIEELKSLKELYTGSKVM